MRICELFGAGKAHTPFPRRTGLALARADHTGRRRRVAGPSRVVVKGEKEEDGAWSLRGLGENVLGAVREEFEAVSR
eukprot:3829064-Rhodomonas_salina.4